MEEVYVKRDLDLIMNDGRVYDMLEELTYKVYRLEDECAIAHAKIAELEEIKGEHIDV